MAQAKEKRMTLEFGILVVSVDEVHRKQQCGQQKTE